MKPTVHQNYASQDQKLTTPKSKDKSLEKTGLPIKGRLENAHVHALRHSAYRWHIHFPKKLIEQRFKFGLPHHETHTHNYDGRRFNSRSHHRYLSLRFVNRINDTLSPINYGT